MRAILLQKHNSFALTRRAFRWCFYHVLFHPRASPSALGHCRLSLGQFITFSNLYHCRQQHWQDHMNELFLYSPAAAAAEAASRRALLYQCFNVSVSERSQVVLLFIALPQWSFMLLKIIGLRHFEKIACFICYLEKM